jgi:hypothetical protein
MKRTFCVCLFLCLTTTFLLSQSSPAALGSTTKADPKVQAKILDAYGKLPLSFEANNGQTDAKVKFLSRTGGYTLFLTGDEAVMTLNGKKPSTDLDKIVNASHKSPSSMATPKLGGVLRMKLHNANPAAKLTGRDELAGKTNYFIGNDPTKWRTNVPTYAKVKYEGIYSGIDLVYYGNQRQLEYDFVVAPGANPRRIAFDVSGAKRIRQDDNGELVFKVGEDEIRWRKPVVYQEKDGARQEIAATYAITDKNWVGFELAKYDTSKTLYIDPLVYSTYLGGSSYDLGYGIAVDSTGNAYVTGYTASTDFPTMNPLQPTYGGAGDAFVTKINPAGSALVYSTYLGGSWEDAGHGIVVDGAGDAYLIGYTASANFPVTPGAFQTSQAGGTNVFVTEINPAGSALVYSTYLGGNNYDEGWNIAVDSAGNAYVTGVAFSTDFPITPGAFQTSYAGDYDAFVTKINPAGSALVYSTYLGGNSEDRGFGIAVDSAGNAYIAGYTASTNFPTTPGAFQSNLAGSGNVFVTKMNPYGSALVYSTYLGGSGTDSGYRIAVDSAGNAYLNGTTNSTNFPMMTPLQATYGGGIYDTFVSKLNPTGSALVYSTYLGGSGTDYGQGIAIDTAGNAYVTGQTTSTNFPVTTGAFQTINGEGAWKAFVSKIPSTTTTTTTLLSSVNPSVSEKPVMFTTSVSSSSGDMPTGKIKYLNGTAVLVTKKLTSGSAKYTTSKLPLGTNIITAVYEGDSSNNGSTSAPVNQIVMAVTTTTLRSSLNPSAYGQAVVFTATVTSGIGAPPDGETVSFMKGTTVLGTGTLSSGTATFETSTLKVGTNSITAVYGGDPNFGGSTSKPVKQVVEK